MEKEIWKPFDLNPMYLISSWGKVQSFYRQHRVLSPGSRKGYAGYILMVDGKRVNALGHRLVATHFIPNPENKPCINHKDFDRSNNYYLNLEWCSHKENIEWSEEHGRRENVRLSRELTIFHNDIEYNSQREAAISVGVTPATISYRCNVGLDGWRKINN